MASLNHKQCHWCTKTFIPRNTGGKRQKYCSTFCKHQFEKELRNWALDQYHQGKANINASDSSVNQKK